MKLSKRTLDILKNFSELNPSVLISEGQVQTTISVAKKTLAQAILEESFPRTFGIYELRKFMGSLGFFSDPDIVFGDNSFTLEDNGKKLQFAYAQAEAIVRPPPGWQEKLKVDEDASFPLTAANLAQVKKAASVLSLPELEFTGDGKNAMVRAVDVRNSSSHSFAIQLGDTDKEFRLVFKVDAFKFIEDLDYTASVSFTKLAKFVGRDVTYTVASEIAGGKR